MQAGKSGKSETRGFPCCSCHFLGNKAGLHFCRLRGTSERHLWDTSTHVGAHTCVQNGSSLNTCTHEQTCTYHHTIHMCMQPSPSLYILNTFILHTCVHILTHLHAIHVHTASIPHAIHVCTHLHISSHYTLCTHPHIPSHYMCAHILNSIIQYTCTNPHILSPCTCVHTSSHTLRGYMCVHILTYHYTIHMHTS